MIERIKNMSLTDGYLLTKEEVCSVLGIAYDGINEEYTKLGFAHDVIPGGIAIVSVNTANPTTVTSPERCVQLAEHAVKRGAKMLLATHQIGEYPCLIVDNVIDAFCALSTHIRERFAAKCIAITGSIGKTTTTQMVAALISSKFNTHKNDSSANNVRLAAEVLQRLKPENEYYVQETMEGPPFGAAATISKMILPSAAIVTVVGTSHLETFGSQERILESCLGIQEGMPEGGLIVLNGDDPLQWNATCSRRCVYYAIKNKSADYYAENIHANQNSVSFDVVHGDSRTDVTINCFGEHNVLNALACFAIGEWAGMTESEIQKGLASYRTSGIRQNFVSYAGIGLYLDCYNAAPESIQTSLDVLKTLPVHGNGRRIALLADIAELGPNEIEFHKKVGRMVAESCADMLIAYGPNSRLIAGEVLLNSKKSVFHTESFTELVDYLRKTVTKSDVVLVKGSHCMELEHVIDSAYGTWFHEVFEEYEYKTRNVSDNNFTYTVYTDHAKPIKKLSLSESVSIPCRVGGKPVTSIGRDLFHGSKYTKSVQLPDTLVSIQFCSFYKAVLLESVHIPASVKIIGESAFNSCTGLTSVHIDDGCTHIGYRAFAYCHALTSINIPYTVQQIGNECFAGCENVLIECEKGSYAEQYCIDRNLPYVYASCFHDPSIR